MAPVKHRRPGADDGRMTTTGDEQAVWLGGNVPAEALMVKLRDEQAGVAPNTRLQSLFGVSPVHPDNRSWYWGARGERIVADRLSRLPDGWTVLHSVPVGTKESDIDHVVIGPGGVYTVNTKEHSTQSVWVGGNTLLVAGHRKDHVRNSRHEAARAAKLLSAAVGFEVPVRGLVVVVEPKRFTVKEQPSDVGVLVDAGLVRWLRKRKPVLEPAQVSAVAAAAQRVATWTTRPVVEPDRRALGTWFESLDRQVHSARRVRMLWSAAAGLLPLGALLYGGPLLLDRVAASLIP